MKTLKIMGIIGLVIAGFSYICLVVFCNPIDYEAGIGWGFIACWYLIALSIVCLVQCKKIKNEKN